MAEIDPVILELIARNDRYEAELRNTTRVAEQQLGTQQRRVQDLEDQIKRSSGEISSQFKRMAGVIAGAFSAREIVRMADSWSDLSSQVGVAVRDMERAPEIMDRLTQVARASYSPLEQTAEQFARNNRTLEQMGYTVNDALNYTEALNNALVATATRGDRARQVQDALSKAIATSRLEAQGLENILTHGGAVAEVLARHLGVTTNELYKLRQEGKITGDVLVQSLINNFDELRAQAEEMPATVGDGFIILRNELMRYLGETDQALGATERMATALIKLGDNIDVVAKAVALLASVMIGRYAAGALVAGRATQALVAHLSIATTSLAGTALAARSAGAALMGVFGGPVGLAVAALTAGIIYYATQVESAAEKTERLTKAAEGAAREADRMEDRLRAAGVEIAKTGDAAKSATRDMDGFSRSIIGTIEKMQQLMRSANMARAAMIGARLQEIEGERAQIARDNRNFMAQSLGAGPFPTANVSLEPDRKQREFLASLAAEETDLKRQLSALAKAMEHNVDVLDDSSDVKAAVTEEKKKKEKKEKGPSAEDIARRAEDEMSRLRQEEIQARLALTDDIDERARLQKELLAEEVAARRRQIENDEYFTAEQKAAQLAIIDALYGRADEIADGDTIVRPNEGLYAQQDQREYNDRAADMARDELAMRADALAAQSAIATTLEQRRYLETAGLEIMQKIQRSLLEEAITQGRIADAAKARALLAEQQSAEQERLRRDNMGARERYIFDLRNREINEAVAGIEVAGLERLNDELAEAVTGAKSLGEAFRNTAQQIIQDLARIAIQQAVIRPLAESLFGAGGGAGALGGLFGSVFGGGRPTNLLAGIPGFNSGGSMMIGGAGGIDQNLLSLNGAPIARVSRGERLDIVPNQQLASPQQGGGTAVVRLELSGDIDARIQSQAVGVAVEVFRASAPQLIDASANETVARITRPTI